MAASSRLGVLMKLDKNQRKPRVFKASDLCPYYNRRVNSSYDSGCFHIYNLLYLFDMGRRLRRPMISSCLRTVENICPNDLIFGRDVSICKIRGFILQ